MRQKQRAANIRKMKRSNPNIEVHVDELILCGFPTANRYVIGDALVHELGRWFEYGESSMSLSKDAHIPVLNAGEIILPPNVKPAAVGERVAQVVYAGLNNTNGGKS